MTSVLLVEDSATHQRLITEAFSRIGYGAPFDVQPDAEGAWAVIERMLRQPESTWPRFALIDINLPGASGIDLVDRIRHVGDLDSWPVVILTASKDPEDVTESLMAHATAFFQKPTSAAGYNVMAREVLAMIGDQAGPIDNTPATGSAGQKTHKGVHKLG